MRGCLVLAALAALACSSPDTPSDVVVRYFETLGRDPMRTLPITTAEFHRRHGLMLASTAPNPGSVDREQLAWLAVQRQPEFTQLVASLTTSILRVEEHDGAADVVVRVETPGEPAFEQRFDLARDARSRWRIEAVAQTGVSDGALPAAFAAYPSRVTQQRLGAGSGRRRAPPHQPQR